MPENSLNNPIYGLLEFDKNFLPVINAFNDENLKIKQKIYFATFYKDKLPDKSYLMMLKPTQVELKNPITVIAKRTQQGFKIGADAASKFPYELLKYSPNSKNNYLLLIIPAGMLLCVTAGTVGGGVAGTVEGLLHTIYDLGKLTVRKISGTSGYEEILLGVANYSYDDENRLVLISWKFEYDSITFLNTRYFYNGNETVPYRIQSLNQKGEIISDSLTRDSF